jgi:membrane-bound inhibitor of C-type lysozyme
MEMNQSSWLVSFLVLNLICIIVLGCSSDRAFKSGITYTCDDGKIFVVELYDKVDIAFLNINKKRFYLPRVASDSGAKYSEGNVTLWIKGKGASVEIEGRSEFKNCTVKPE